MPFIVTYTRIPYLHMQVITCTFIYCNVHAHMSHVLILIHSFPTAATIWLIGATGSRVRKSPLLAQRTRGDSWCIVVIECPADPDERAGDLGETYSPRSAGHQPMSQSWVDNEPVCSSTGDWNEHSRRFILYWRNHVMPG